jgi:hypothetical protein
VLGEDADARRGLVATGSGIQGDVISAILASRGYRQTPTAATTPEAPKVDVPVPAATPQVKAEVAGVAVVGDKSVVSDPGATPSKDKRPRGRPRIYIDGQAPTSGARTQRSLKALADAGGKRLMLRLAPDSMAALREIMTVRGIKQETTAINTLIQEAAAAGKAA